MVGGIHGRGHSWYGVCAWQRGDVHDRGHVWQGVRACMARGAWQGEGIQPLKCAVRILLERILVFLLV